MSLTSAKETRILHQDDLPLAGMQVVEFEGIGPGPLAGRLLCDMGAEVTVVARPRRSGEGLPPSMTPAADAPLLRGKHQEPLDLKREADRARALALISAADVLLEGYRPGVMERLGVGPADVAAINPRLVYARLTGWGQDGPLAHAAGHDLNYVALTGLLSMASAPEQAPRVPPTVVGDAVGALGAVCGIVAAYVKAQRGGCGSVVDAAIIDVLAMLSPLLLLTRSLGEIDGGRPSVFHDSPFYDSYACADGRFLTVGAIEPQFYRELLRRLGLEDVDPADQWQRELWPDLKARLRTLFASQPLAHWTGLLEGTDACYAPVLTLEEAAEHHHNRARGLYEHDPRGNIVVARALRFSGLSA